MSSAWMLEPTRAAAEEIEALEMGLVEELEGVTRKSHKSKLAQELRIRNMLIAARDRAKRIKPIEVKPQGGVEEFYKRKKQMEETNRNRELTLEDDPSSVARLCALGGEMVFADEEEERATIKPKNRLERRQARAKIDEFVLSQEKFTGEEHFGRYLDLHDIHLQYQNLNSSHANTSYLDYLRSKIEELPPKNIKSDLNQSQYLDYLVALREYLQEFEKRATPLAALGREDDSSSSSSSNAKPFENEMMKATSAADLEKTLSLPQLKSALEARGLKASGTAVQRAARLFAVRSLQPDQYPIELLSTSSGNNRTTTVVADATSFAKRIKEEEDRVRALLDRLRPILQATQTMITKKLTMTYEEIDQELKDEERELEQYERSDDEDGTGAGDNNDEDDDEKLKANGVMDPATGRLIPKWKFRLYGLHQEFKCEICGGQSYFGRKAYDKHFRDFKHANGMRALGIPNTAHFHDITSIADARKLYESLKKDLEKSEFNRQQEEEFEDSEGNVLTRSAYEDLKREGLL